MIKNIISLLAVVSLLFIGMVFETGFLNKEFEEFNTVLEVLYDKVNNQTAEEADVYAVQKSWLDKKTKLHAFIPHNDIKEIDLWLSESATLVRDKEWHDAISKIEVLIELTEQIPQTYRLSLSNIF